MFRERLINLFDIYCGADLGRLFFGDSISERRNVVPFIFYLLSIVYVLALHKRKLSLHPASKLKDAV